MCKIVSVSSGSCAYPLLADRSGATTPCGSKAVVSINGILYCTVHADEQRKDWREQANNPKVPITKVEGAGRTTDVATLGL